MCVCEWSHTVSVWTLLGQLRINCSTRLRGPFFLTSSLFSLTLFLSLVASCGMREGEDVYVCLVGVKVWFK